jgi:hypothetical protein
VGSQLGPRKAELLDDPIQTDLEIAIPDGDSESVVSLNLDVQVCRDLLRHQIIETLYDSTQDWNGAEVRYALLA